MSENQTKDKISKPEPRWWKLYWIGLVLVTIVLGIIIPILGNIPLERAIIYVILALVAEGIAYYGRVRSSIRLNRVMYILLGVPIGGVLWIISASILSKIYYQGTSMDIAIIVSLVVCFGVGALIGDMIGRLRDYKGPEQYQP